MKKSTLALAALLTTLSIAPVMSVAYADDTTAPATAATTCAGCKGTDCKGATECKGADCKGATECKGAE